MKKLWLLLIVPFLFAGVIKESKEDEDISFYVNKGGVMTKALEVDGATANVDFTNELNAADIPNLSANKITSDTLDTARIPNLSANKITSDTLGTARIPNLDASKITSGTLDISRTPYKDEDNMSSNSATHLATQQSIKAYVDVNRTEFYGSKEWQATSSCIWTISNTGWAIFPSDEDCDNNTRTFEGNAVADSSNDGKQPKIRFSSLEPGYYRVVATGNFTTAYGTDPTTCEFGINDGTNTKYVGGTTMISGRNVFSSIETIFKYETTQGDTTFSLGAYGDSDGDCFIIASLRSALKIDVYNFPL